MTNLVINEETYNQCRKKVFQERNMLVWGNIAIPSLDVINLILSITGKGTIIYGPEDLAVVWAIETHFNKRPTNEGNIRGGKVVSVDIGPARINYPTWLGPGTNAERRRRVLGTNLDAGQIFNGDPKENLKYAWEVVIPKLGGPVRYNSGSSIRPIAVAKLKPELKSFFTCMMLATTIQLETPTMPSRLGNLPHPPIPK